MAKLELRKSMIVTDINNGMTRPELAEKYGINKNQLKRALDKLGLSKVKAKKCDVDVINDVDEVSAPAEVTAATAIVTAVDDTELPTAPSIPHEEALPTATEQPVEQPVGIVG